MKRPVKNQSATPADLTVSQETLLLLAWKETLADLTPGLAHDFNNALTGILALSEAHLAQMDAAHPFHESLLQIRARAHEASQAIHRVSRLYGQKTGSRSYEDASSVAAEMLEVLRNIIPRRIEVRAKFCAEPLPVYVDAVDFRRVVLNLSMRAVHRLQDQGVVHFETSRHQSLPALSRFEGELPRLPAVCLSIAHSGNGSRPEEADSLSDSSLGASDALALGLYYANAFVEKNRGALSLESKRRLGSTVSIWLAQADFTE